MQMLREIESDFSWQHFTGSSPEHERNRQLRDKIVARLLADVDAQLPIIVDNETQLEAAIQSHFGGPEFESYYSELAYSNAVLRNPTPPNNLNDLEISLCVNRETEAKYLEKHGENMSKRTAYRGESREDFPYFWSSVFKGNCDVESSLCLNRSDGHRQISPIYHYVDEALIDPITDPPSTFAAELYPKDMRMASLSLQAESYGLALGKCKTAALVSRQDYCQKVPSTDQLPQRACRSEGMTPCYKCERYGL